MNEEKYIYIPVCKIIKCVIIPKITNVLYFHLRSKDTLAKNLATHPLLKGKVEFTFGIELSENFKQNKKNLFFNLFACEENNLTKIKKKEVSALFLFSPQKDRKIDTIGLGIENKSITIYNDFWDFKEVQILYQATKLLNKLPPTYKSKKHKI